MTLAVLSAVSEAEGVDPLELTPPLGDAIDTDALQRFVERSSRPTDVVFDYRQWEVTVRSGDGVEVTLSPLGDRYYECICDTCGTRELTTGLRAAQRYFNDHAADGCAVTLRHLTSSATPVVPDCASADASSGDTSPVED